MVGTRVTSKRAVCPALRGSDSPFSEPSESRPLVFDGSEEYSVPIVRWDSLAAQRTLGA
jgi:hypothetical protein